MGQITPASLDASTCLLYHFGDNSREDYHLAELQLSSGWASYLRVSDEDKQSPERSFAMQRKSIQKQLLIPSTSPLKQEYRDKLTGTSPNRADYQQMLTDAEAGRSSHVDLY